MKMTFRAVAQNLVEFMGSNEDTLTGSTPSCLVDDTSNAIERSQAHNKKTNLV